MWHCIRNFSKFSSPSLLRPQFIHYFVGAASLIILARVVVLHITISSHEYYRLPHLYDSLLWNEVPQQNPVQTLRQVPPIKALNLPRIQAHFGRESRIARSKRRKRQAEVKRHFQHAWKGYKEHAWLHDELSPVSGGNVDPFSGWATTLVDSLDTLWILGLRTEFEEAVDALQKIDFSRSTGDVISVFESTIRYLGGFLGAYDISGGKYPLLLSIAHNFGDMLYAAFDTPNRMPVSWWKWNDAVAGKPQRATNGAPLADFASLSLEFTRLSQLTGDTKFYDAISRITDELEKSQMHTKLPGMWPITLDASTLGFYGARFGLGALSDSAYEYLPKQYLLLGGQEPALQYKRMYELAIETIKQHIFWRPMAADNPDILFSGNAEVYGDGQVHLDSEVSHLTCFTGGMVELASKLFNRTEEMAIGQKLTQGCVWAYKFMPSEIMPESLHMMACSSQHDCEWDEADWRAKASSSEDLLPGVTRWDDRRYHLRPEAIESLFINYRLTGNTTYQDQAWDMFTSIANHTRTPIAHAALVDVTQAQPVLDDKMESFWLAETLKYFYLIFADPNVVSLDDYVLNTEAHPFKIPR